MLMQVLSLTNDQVNALPPDQQASVIALVSPDFPSISFSVPHLTDEQASVALIQRTQFSLP
jgi:hypothetical protein